MSDPSRLLEELADATRLNEGPEGVRKVLRAIYRSGPVPIRELARDLGIPVPVVAAVRGELETRGLAVRETGVKLTSLGVEILETACGIACKQRFTITSVTLLPEGVLSLVQEFAKIVEARPGADFTLDQSHATAETSIRRALYLYEHDAIEGRTILFLGDDDLTSIAVGLVSRHLGIKPARLVVLDVDDRLTGYIAACKEELHPVETVCRDLREALPESLMGKADVFFTDPPYTIDGLRLFGCRGVSALKQEVGKLGFVSFGHKSPSEGVAIGQTLSGLGLSLVEITPDFNQYDGAQLLAGSSQMIRLVYGGSSHLSGEFYKGPLYTRDVRGKKRG
ncbi:bis-aminopropyl spermidine synthase family protein [bacterium]|jgi:predicted methyltransferase|nr:hypothetical protein [Gemmatimonadota bacterium]MCH2664602.1 bis-aminopropyl spermidine synthase family protein [bacterium]HCK09510.1 hypothetical protein [Candidatus Latescibacterota bacterium]